MKVQLTKEIDREEFDYTMLLSALDGYSNPRAKITSLLRKGVIVRVKKGMYIFGADYRRRPFCRELLANLVYGPSFVSLEFALFSHGLIPDRPSAITSMTYNRHKRFDTPVGIFVYRKAPEEGFHMGVSMVESDSTTFLMAGPERALADTLRDRRNGPIRSQREIAEYLFDNLRVDRKLFAEMNLSTLGTIVDATGCGKGAQAVKLLGNLQGAA